MTETVTESAEILIPRPRRWEKPFGDDMTDEAVDFLMQIKPFSLIQEAAFPPKLPLRGILRNDTRIVDFANGDLIVREGDYGNSAFLILKGQVRVALQGLPNGRGNHYRPPKKGLLQTVARLFRPTPKVPEVRRQLGQLTLADGVDLREERDQIRIFLQDVPRVLSNTSTATMGVGEIFGELAALNRAARSATVFAEGPVRVLEIRWQGLRDLMKRTPAMKEYIEFLYRSNSLRVHLRETPLFKQVPTAAMERIADAARFDTYGNFDWYSDFCSYAERDPTEQIQKEPLIAERGQIPEHLILIRNGHARLSLPYAQGERTVNYLGKGAEYGLAELVQYYLQDEPQRLQYTLRAIGYVDTIAIPRDVLFSELLPHISPEQIPPLERPVSNKQGPPSPDAPRIEPLDGPLAEMPEDVVDFFVDNRFVNGTASMLIDLERCTRCDDCVQACAATHDGNPRFTRQGPKHGRWMVANACMHCLDPVCLIGCPTGAIIRDQGSGSVCINEQTCIGCSTCSNNCPYDAIRMVEIREPTGPILLDEKTSRPILQATKCDLCVGQFASPACENACPHDALTRVSMQDQTQLITWLNR